MTNLKSTLLKWIDNDAEELVDFFSRFVKAKSPNPPGDTTEAVAFICEFLDKRGLPYRPVAPQPTMPNVVVRAGTSCSTGTSMSIQLATKLGPTARGVAR